MENLTLFPEDKAAVFKTAKSKYGVWPTTVWEIDYSKNLTKEIKRAIGDGGTHRKGSNKNGYWTARRGCFQTSIDNETCYRITESIFNPQICSIILNMYAPGQGICFDPFAGGGTRAILAAAHGLQYEGVELRREEVDAIIMRADNAGASGGIKIVCGDSRYLTDHFRDDYADFLITCPPYWNLEKYEGGESDLSMINDYGRFIDELGKVVAESGRILKPGATACWVVGLHRQGGGAIAPLHHDLTRLHLAAGFDLREEIILSHKNNGAIQRVGNFEKGNKLLIRTHEYCMVYTKR